MSQQNFIPSIRFLAICILFGCILISSISHVDGTAMRLPSRTLSHVKASTQRELQHTDFEPHIVAAVLPGSPLVTGTLTQGICNGISIFSNILLLRFALSWFPQIQQKFPILRPINTLTEPYLKIFRSTIPPIGGFDISAIPAIFILDILSQTAVAIGAEIPPQYANKIFKPSPADKVMSSINKNNNNNTQKRESFKALGKTTIAK